MRASKVSLLGLGVRAVLQGVLVVFTGSVALPSDTIHNLTDALTAVPLWIAFAPGRRRDSKRFTFGLGRAEDLAGLITLVAAVDPDLSVPEGHRIAHAIAHDVMHAFTCTTEVLVHIDPSGEDDAHHATEHHR